MAHASQAALSNDTAEWNGLFSRVGSELQTLAEAVHTLQDFMTPLVAEFVARYSGGGGSSSE